MKKILIFGGDGFIGKNLIEEFTQEYELVSVSRTPDENFLNKYSVKFYQCDVLNNRKKLHFIIQEETPDFVFNLISIVNGARDFSLLDKMIKINIQTINNLFDALIKNPNLKLFLQFGSIEEYGNIFSPYKETDRENPNSPYSLTKQAATNMSIMMAKTYGFPASVIRCGNVIGKYQNEDKFIPYLIRNFIQNKPVEMSSGEQKRDYIHVKDFALIIKQILENPEKFIGEIINVTSGENYSLREIAEHAKSFLRSESDIYYGSKTKRSNDPDSLQADIKKLKFFTDYTFQYDTLEALEDYINYQLSLNKL